MIANVEPMITAETVFTKENMQKAAREVARKKSSGVDGISAKEALAYIEEHYEEIHNQLINENYYPDEVLLKQIPKDGISLKMRPLAIATVKDRIIQRVLNEVLMPIFESDMLENSYGFRKNHNCYMAVEKAKKYFEQGYEIVIKLDLSNCFNHLDHDLLLYHIRQKVSDKTILELLNRYLKVTYIKGNNRVKSFIGSPQGSSLSPLYANIILNIVDKELMRRNLAFIRYADDICIFCKSEKASKRIQKSITRFIEKRCKLLVNQEKSKICYVDDGMDILGFHIYRGSGEIHLIPKEKNIKKFKERIKMICSSGKGQMLVNELNPIINGWVNYYTGAEISLTTRKLDLFIKKQLDKAEKRTGIKIDRSGLCSCHKVYKVRGRSYQKDAGRCMFSAMNGATANPNSKEDKTAVSFRGRSPPLAETIQQIISQQYYCSLKTGFIQ